MTDRFIASIKEHRLRLYEKRESLNILIDLASEGYELDTFKETADGLLMDIYIRRQLS